MTIQKAVGFIFADDTVRADNPSPKGQPKQESSASTVPTLACAGCGKVYRIGDDAVAVTLEYGLGLARGAVILADGSAADREDLVAALDVSPEILPGAREKARQNWKIIQDSLSKGHRRNLALQSLRQSQCISMTTKHNTVTRRNCCATTSATNNCVEISALHVVPFQLLPFPNNTDLLVVVIGTSDAQLYKVNISARSSTDLGVAGPPIRYYLEFGLRGSTPATVYFSAAR